MAEIGARQPLHGLPIAQCSGHFVAVRAEVERAGKASAHIVEAIDQAARDLALQEGTALPIARRALAPPAQHGAVEDQHGIETRHPGYVGGKPADG